MRTLPDALLKSGQALCSAVEQMDFSPEVTHVYNPLAYAWEPYAQYLRKWASTPKQILFLGMNPGPFGMAQTGIPFGEVPAVRDWLGISTAVGKPPMEHPSRPILGFACPRSEVSGKRLWGLFAEDFESSEQFFRKHLVLNYCPLLFLDGSANRCRNITPDKLPTAKTEALYRACDQHLVQAVQALKVDWVIGIGKFAEAQATRALGGSAVKIGTILHPSPASPLANRGWPEQARKQLQAMGLWRNASET